MRFVWGRPLVNRIALVAALAVVVGAVGCGGSDSDSDTGDEAAASSESVTLRYSGFNTDKSSIGQAAGWYMDEVENQTDGQIKFDRFFNGTLVPAEETLAAITDGRADTGQIAGPYYPAELPLDQIAGIPFLAPDAAAHAETFKSLYENDDAFRAQYEDRGVTVLAWAINTPSFLGLKEPIDSVDDLKGKRIRAVGYLAEAVKAAGAEPVAIGPPEIYEAMQRGTIDGFTSLPLDVATDLALHEVSSDWVDAKLGSIASIGVVTMNKERFAELPDDLQATLIEVGEGAIAQAETITGETVKPACEKLAGSDVEVSALSDAEVERWKEMAVEPALDKWAESAQASGTSAEVTDAFRENYLATIDEMVSEEADGVFDACETGT